MARSSVLPTWVNKMPPSARESLIWACGIDATARATLLFISRISAGVAFLKT